jgi:predicted hydrocarbon binding protein
MDQMAQTHDLRSRRMVALTSNTLDALRDALLRDGSVAGATQLQDAGFAGGDALYAAFCEWLAGRTDTEAGELPTQEFGEYASEFFREAGWGSFRLGALGDSVATIDTTDWREADSSAALAHPGCHLTTGMLAGFFAAAGSAPIAALEVECRGAGGDRCRFLLGAGPVLTHIFEQVEGGASYEEALRR